MHIVFVMANCSSVPYFNWFAEKSKEYPDIKFTFVCLYPTEPKMLEDMKGFGCDCYWVKFDSDNRKMDFIKSTGALYKLFKKLKPDVVHSHLFDDSLPSMLAARLAGVKVRAITKADTGYHYTYTPKWVKFDKFNNNNATHVVAISEECKSFVLEKEDANPAKVHLVHHGIPVDKFTDQRDEYKQYLIDKYNLKGKRLVGTVARLIEWKGYKTIIEVARAVVQKIPDVVFVFVGLGDQKEELETLISKYGLEENIVFAGWVERKMIPSLYGLLDVYLHAAQKEPFGFVIAEAMMNGCPLVSTPTGAAKDAIIDRENGILVEYGDLEAMTEAVMYILENDVSQLKKEAKKTALAMYDFEHMWKNHIEIYSKKSSLI